MDDFGPIILIIVCFCSLIFSLISSVGVPVGLYETGEIDLPFYKKDGDSCRFSFLCKSGKCNSSWGGLKKGVCYSPNTIKDGKTCSKDDQCVSGACANVYKKGSICCPSGSKHLYWGKHYCDNLPDGWPSNRKEYCASGKETNNQCYTPGEVVVGGVCTKDGDCADGKVCAKPSKAYTKKHCCPSGKKGDYCLNMPINSHCPNGEYCAEGLFCDKGVCKPKGKPNDPCSKDDNCISGKCAKKDTYDKSKICCPTGKTKDGYCYPMELNYHCPSDELCASGMYCDKKTKQCTKLLANNTKCDDDKACASGKCAEKDTYDKSKICCPTGQVKGKYCHPMGLNYHCPGDEYCAAGMYCDKKTKQCTNYVGSGGTCTDKSQCSPGLSCSWFSAYKPSGKRCCKTVKDGYCYPIPKGAHSPKDDLCASGKRKGGICL